MNYDKSSEIQYFYSGEHYLDFIGALAHELKPNSYFEIGTNAGGSLSRINCDALCVDPKFLIAGHAAADRGRTLLYQMDSDSYFSRYNPKSDFPDGIDLAFLDGMHWFEFLLRDFINTERYCHRASLVLLHDCMPANLRLAERIMRVDEAEDERTRFGWTGDVWKILPILATYRPDLIVRILDCPPTGLIALSNLDPESNALKNNFHRILAEYAELSLEQFGLEKLHGMYPRVDTRYVAKGSRISSLFTVR